MWGEMTRPLSGGAWCAWLNLLVAAFSAREIKRRASVAAFWAHFLSTALMGCFFGLSAVAIADLFCYIR
jgi:hypothetical protein